MEEVAKEVPTSEASASEEPSAQTPEGGGPKKGIKPLWLDRFFQISDRGSSILRELLGGLVTFLAMFYILNVNSGILCNWFSGFTADGNVWLYGSGEAAVYISASSAYSGLFIATALSAGITTIVMGVFGKLPVGLASGMGINSMVATYVMGRLGFSFAQAMCLVFIDGVIFLILSLTPVRGWIVRAIPKDLKIAISAGIGLFIAYLGLKTSGIISVDGALAMGDLTNPSTLLCLIGVVLVCALSCLPQKNKILTWISRFSVIIVMLVLGIIEASLAEGGVATASSGFLLSSEGNWGNFGQLFGVAFRGFDAFVKPEAYVVVFTLLFIDFFDTTGTLVGVEIGAGMVDKNGNLTVDDRNAMITDAAGTVLGSVMGTTTVTSFVESTSGVAAGARTGLASVLTGLLFCLSTFLYPILGIFSGAVPNIALVFVGVCMFKNLADLDWKNWISIVSGFVTVVTMICMASISDGIAFGFITYSLCKAISGKFSKKDIPVTVIAVLFLGLYVMEFASGIK